MKRTRTPAAAQKAPSEDDRVMRRQLLEATTAVMIEAGRADVSLQAIAIQARVTAPLVKYYFGGKEGLLLALAKRDTGRAVRQLDELMALECDPQEKLRMHIAAIVRTYARHPYLNGLLNLLLRDDTTPAAQEIRRTFIAPLAAAQRRMLEEGERAGVFRAVDPAMFYFIVVGACQNIFSTRVALKHLLNGAPVDDKMARSYGKAVVDLVFSGLLSKG